MSYHLYCYNLGVKSKAKLYKAIIRLLIYISKVYILFMKWINIHSQSNKPSSAILKGFDKIIIYWLINKYKAYVHLEKYQNWNEKLEILLNNNWVRWVPFPPGRGRPVTDQTSSDPLQFGSNVGIHTSPIQSLYEYNLHHLSIALPNFSFFWSAKHMKCC